MYNTGVDREAYHWFRATHAEYGHLYVTALVDLEVDEETGQITILQVVNSHDTGKALNPLNVRGQLIGGGSQGIGWTLMEDLQVKEGRILTPYPTGPYGAKGVGEHGMDSVPGAIMNAIFDATGLVLDEWPVTAEKMWAALKKHKAAGAAGNG